MNISKKKFVILMMVSFLFGGSIATAIPMMINSGNGGENDKLHSKTDEIYRLIDQSYYEDVDEKKLIDGACKGLVAGLEDPYSAYLTASEYENLLMDLEGEYSGIGVTFMEDKYGNYIVVSVAKDSPAEMAGIQEGDILLKADGKTYSEMDLFAEAIRGKENTKVKITYKHNEKKSEVEITRKNIVQHSVEYKMIDEKIGYISISSFIETTDDDFADALKTIESKGAEGLILDLRNNGGGLLNTCIPVADEFIDEGAIVYVEDKEKNSDAYEASEGKTNLKTVVLVNENTVSAAEILAAALKDNGYELVGQKTYGKGVIQSTTQLKDGSALKLTIMQYYSPDRNPINKIGIMPDYKVKNKEGSKVDSQLDKAKELLEE